MMRGICCRTFGNQKWKFPNDGVVQTDKTDMSSVVAGHVLDCPKYSSNLNHESGVDSASTDP